VKLDPAALEEAGKVGASGCLLTAYGGFLACFPLALGGGLLGVWVLYLWASGRLGG